LNYSESSKKPIDSFITQFLLGYADDLLVICSSLTQLRKVLEIIRVWSSQNNLKLNEKSGIMEFLLDWESFGP